MLTNFVLLPTLPDGRLVVGAGFRERSARMGVDKRTKHLFLANVAEQAERSKRDVDMLLLILRSQSFDRHLNSRLPGGSFATLDNFKSAYKQFNPFRPALHEMFSAIV